MKIAKGNREKTAIIASNKSAGKKIKSINITQTAGYAFENPEGRITVCLFEKMVQIKNEARQRK